MLLGKLKKVLGSGSLFDSNIIEKLAGKMVLQPCGYLLIFSY